MNKGTIRHNEQKISEIGFDIKENRLKRGLSQPVVAKYCGVSCTALQRWENGSSKVMKREHYEKLKEILDN